MQVFGNIYACIAHSQCHNVRAFHPALFAESSQSAVPIQNNTEIMPHYLKKFSTLRGDSGRLFALNSLTAMSYSLIMPIMGFFLIEQLQTPPAYIGIYTISTAVSGVMFSQLLGGWVDRGGNGRTLFMMAMLAAFCAALAFANINTFWQALLVGVCLMGFASASIPMLLAMIRKFAEKSGKNSLALNSQMRSGVSLVWIIGPTLAFTTVDQFGFSANFYLSAGLSLMVIIMAWVYLPEQSSLKKPQSQQLTSKSFSMDIGLLGAVMLLGNLANTLYLTAIPLYLTQDLELPVSLPGMLMGLTAALEIPIMLLVPRWASRFGRHRIFTIGFLFALAFYLLLQVAESPWQLFVLQLFNGAFFGIFAGLGISLIQDAATDRPGFASAFYTNAMRFGMMGGTSLAGILAQFWGFKFALLGAVVAIVFALVFMVLIIMRQAPPKLHIKPMD